MDSPSYQRYLQTRRFGSLDGLRFLCIAAVLWHHAPMEAQTTLLTRGFLGVDFFFVISGFLITTLLLREEDATGRISLAGFYQRRILRIVPVYFLVVTVVAAGYILLKGETEYARLLPAYYLFLSNYLVDDIPTLSMTWSLAVEEQYYLIWPLLLILTPRRWLPMLLILLIVVNLLAVTGALRRFGIVPFIVGPLRFEMFTATFVPILLGSAAALALNSRSGFAVLAGWFGGRWSCVALFLAVLLLVQFLPTDITGWPNLILHLAMTAALVSIVVREDHAMQPFLGWRPVARIGQISYGIYLYHMLSLHVVNAAGFTGKWPILVVYAAVSILVAEISFRTFEAYFLRMRGKPVAPVGAAPAS